MSATFSKANPLKTSATFDCEGSKFTMATFCSKAGFADGSDGPHKIICDEVEIFCSKETSNSYASCNANSGTPKSKQCYEKYKSKISDSKDMATSRCRRIYTYPCMAAIGKVKSNKLIGAICPTESGEEGALCDMNSFLGGSKECIGQKNKVALVKECEIEHDNLRAFYDKDGRRLKANCTPAIKSHCKSLRQGFVQFICLVNLANRKTRESLANFDNTYCREIIGEALLAARIKPDPTHANRGSKKEVGAGK